MTQPFPVALGHLYGLLEHEHWPVQVSWVAPEHVLAFPKNITALFRPGQVADTAVTEQVFEAARGRSIPIELYGVGFLNGTSYAFVRPIEELGQGESMFLQGNVKVAVSASPPRLHIVRARIWWSLLCFQHRRWLRRRALMLKKAA